MIKKLVWMVAKRILYSFPSSYILMFHHIESEPKIKCSNCVLETEAFYKVIEHYEPQKYVAVEQLLRHSGKRKLAITFDDGLEDVYQIAYPYLKSKCIPFCIFVVTDFLDTPGYITTEQLVEMSRDPLVTIGSHGITHTTLTELSDAEAKREITDSKKLLEDMLGQEVRLFSYSHGEFNKKILRHARIYDYAVSVMPLPVNVLTRARRKIPRINIDAQTNLDDKFKKIDKIL